MDEDLKRIIDGEYLLEENRKIDQMKNKYKKIKNMSAEKRKKLIEILAILKITQKNH